MLPGANPDDPMLPPLPICLVYSDDGTLGAYRLSIKSSSPSSCPPSYPIVAAKKIPSPMNPSAQTVSRTPLPTASKSATSTFSAQMTVKPVSSFPASAIKQQSSDLVDVLQKPTNKSAAEFNPAPAPESSLQPKTPVVQRSSVVFESKLPKPPANIFTPSTNISLNKSSNAQFISAPSKPQQQFSSMQKESRVVVSTFETPSTASPSQKLVDAKYADATRSQHPSGKIVVAKDVIMLKEPMRV